MYEEMIVAGATALHDLSRYSNIEVSFGRCPCQEECPNLRLVVWRLSEDSERGGPVSFGVGPDVWTAALDAHVRLAKAIEEAEAREEEISYLQDIWDASEES